MPSAGWSGAAKYTFPKKTSRRTKAGPRTAGKQRQFGRLSLIAVESSSFWQGISMKQELATCARWKTMRGMEPISSAGNRFAVEIKNSRT